MSEQVQTDYAREAYEWKRWAGVLFRIGIGLGLAQLISVFLIVYLMVTGCS